MNKPEDILTEKPEKIKIKRVIIDICEPCLNGEGKECHTPGCALCYHRVDLPIIKDLYHVVCEYED